MKQQRASRRLIQMWHRREKATIDHLVHNTGETPTEISTTHSAFTASGLAIEDQVRKAWSPGPTGLAVF